MSAWRQVGLNYINYSNVAAKTLRKALKPEFRADALKRDTSHVKITPWVDGKPAGKYLLLGRSSFSIYPLVTCSSVGLLAEDENKSVSSIQSEKYPSSPQVHEMPLKFLGTCRCQGKTEACLNIIFGIASIHDTCWPLQFKVLFNLTHVHFFKYYFGFPDEK